MQKNFEDLRADFLAQVPTGEGPDITVGAHDWLGELVESGVVDTIDLGDRAADFEQVTLDAFTYDGQLYALPYAQEPSRSSRTRRSSGRRPPPRRGTR